MSSGCELRHHRYHFVVRPRSWVKFNLKTIHIKTQETPIGNDIHGHGKLTGGKLGLLQSGQERSLPSISGL